VAERKLTVTQQAAINEIELRGALGRERKGTVWAGYTGVLFNGEVAVSRVVANRLVALGLAAVDREDEIGLTKEGRRHAR
jgi:hypothetical protein